MSTPEPAPSATMNFTGRCGQVCALGVCAVAVCAMADGVTTAKAASMPTRANKGRKRRIGILRLTKQFLRGFDRSAGKLQEFSQGDNRKKVAHRDMTRQEAVGLRRLVSRFRSSHILAAISDANFGIPGTLATL